MRTSFPKIALLSVLTVWQNANAYPIGRFPGLSELIKKADVVAIVDVWGKREPPMDLIAFDHFLDCIDGTNP